MEGLVCRAETVHTETTVDKRDTNHLMQAAPAVQEGGIALG